ncbi:MAG: insulinase family protein [Bacteroidales bacterium]|nr:insulinase family protein [Bacteroidales bacterium]
MIQFERFQLDNGLTVLVHQDLHTPMAAVNILYKVGARDEDPEKTGFAHLFEHLMFGGSINIPSYDNPLQQAGGENNAFTNNDFTNYYLTLPKNNLETAFWLESDRMLSLAFSKKSLKVQKQVVIEEFKQNYLNQPYGDVYLLLKPLVYKTHPYQWNTIGKEISHIEKATMSDVKSFYARYYNPNNAVMCVSGNVQPEKVFQQVENWFGSIPSGATLDRNYPAEPEQKENRTLLVERDVPQNAMYMAWHMPSRTDENYYTCDLISDLLSNGDSSRLFQRLVKEKQLFTDINAYITGDIDPGLFIISGKLNADVDFQTAEQEIDVELTELKEHWVEEEELQKVKNKLEANLVFSEISILGKAMSLSYFEMLSKAENINNEIEKYRSVSRENIREQAQKMFAEGKKNVLYYKAKQSS